MATGNKAKISIEIGIDSKTGKYNLRQISKDVDTFGNKAEKSGKKADKSFKKMGLSANSLLKDLRNLKGAVGGIATALAVREIVEAGASFFQTGIKVDRLSRSLETATGSAVKARAAQNFLRVESERLGLVYLDQIKGYRDIAAASKAYNFNLQKTQGIYLGVAEAATAMQMTQDDVNGVFRAFTQILSKGKLQAEELRGQIGERLPGAFNIAAKAMGVTTAELNKMMELGEVIAEDFIPKFSKQLRVEFAVGLDNAAQSAQANINRLKNTWLEMQVAVLGSGAMDALQASLKGVNLEMKDWLIENEEMLKQKVPEYVDDVTESAKSLHATLAGMKSLADTLPGGVAEWGIIGYALFKGGPGAAGVASGLLTANHYLKDMEMNLGSLGTKARSFKTDISELWDAAQGRRDVSTGEIIKIDELKGIKKKLSGLQWMVDQWKDENATPAGFFMSWFYGESPLEHWKGKLKEAEHELLLFREKQARTRGKRVAGLIDFENIKSEATAGLKAVRINFLEPYKFEIDRVLEYGNTKWSEYFGLLGEMEGGAPDFKKIYDVEAPETEKARIRAIAGVVAALEEEAKIYGKTAAEIVEYKLEQLGASEADIARARTAADLIEKLSKVKTETEKLASATVDLNKFFEDMDSAESSRVDSIENVISALEREKNTYGMTAKGIQLYELRLASASGATLKHAQEIVDAIALLEDKKDEESWLDGMGDALDNYKKKSLDTASQVNAAVTGGFDSMEDALVEFCMTGKLNFADFARSIIADMVRIAIQQKVTGPLAQILTGIVTAGIGAGVGAAAGGGAGSWSGGAGYDTGAVAGWKHGGTFPSGISEHTNTITDKPTVFMFAKGAGVYGEAGPEAIMPLTRLPGGDLGVKAEGSTTTEVRPLEIHIHEAAGTTSRVEQSDDGERLDVIVEQVEQALTGRMARGTGMAPFMDGRYKRGY